MLQYGSEKLGDHIREQRTNKQTNKMKQNFASPLSGIIAKSNRSQNGTIFVHDVCTFPQVISKRKSKEFEFCTNVLYLLRVRLKAGL